MQAPFLLIPPLLLRLCLLFRRRPGVFSFLCVRWVPENRNSSSSRHHRRRRPDCLLSVQKQYYYYGRLQCRAVPGRAAGRRTRRVHSLKETRERGIKILSCGIRSWFFCLLLGNRLVRRSPGAFNNITSSPGICRLLLLISLPV